MLTMESVDGPPDTDGCIDYRYSTLPALMILGLRVQRIMIKVSFESNFNF